MKRSQRRSKRRPTNGHRGGSLAQSAGTRRQGPLAMMLCTLALLGASCGNDARVAAEAPALPPSAPLGLKIKAPPAVDEGHLVHVELQGTGDVREIPYKIHRLGDPQPVSETDIVRDPNNDKKFAFTGEAGVYTISAHAIGKTAGFVEAEHHLQIRERYQAPPPPLPPTQPQTTEELLRSWALEVKSASPDVELLEIAKAAHETAADIRDGRLPASKAVTEWANKAYLRLTPNVFRVWNENPGGVSFFGHLQELVRDNVQAAEAEKKTVNVANLLDGLATILEGK